MSTGVTENCSRRSRKEYPPEATAATILSYLEQYALLRSLQVERIDVSGLSPELTLQLAALVKRYDAWTLKRFAEPKRHAMLACFLTEAQKTVLDHLAEMHDRLLAKIVGTGRFCAARLEKILAASRRIAR